MHNRNVTYYLSPKRNDLLGHEKSVRNVGAHCIVGKDPLWKSKIWKQRKDHFLPGPNREGEDMEERQAQRILRAVHLFHEAVRGQTHSIMHLATLIGCIALCTFQGR